VIELSFPGKEESKLLFEENLEVDSEGLERTKRRRGDLGEADFRVLLSRENKVAVRKPKSHKLGIPQEIQNEMARGYEYYEVAFICTFDPDIDCKFTKAKLNITMHCEPRTGRNEEERNPVVCDLFPERIIDETRVKNKIGISLGAGYETFKFKIEGSSEREAIVYEPRIIATGRGGRSPSWSFKGTTSMPTIDGDKFLLLIVKKPEDRLVRGRFKLDTRIETLGRVGLPFFNKKTMEVTYEIC
jgi:hypothetical protein